MSLIAALRSARTEEDVKDAYIKALCRKGVRFIFHLMTHAFRGVEFPCCDR